MRFAPTPTNGRALEGETPLGEFRVEWDAQGRLVSESITIRTPANHDPRAAPPPRRGCAGCGGEKFEPPVDPTGQEAILREHYQP